MKMFKMLASSRYKTMFCNPRFYTDFLFTSYVLTILFYILSYMNSPRNP